MTPVFLRVLFGTCLLLAVSAWDLPTLFGRDLADNINDDKRTSPPRPNKGPPGGCTYCGLLGHIQICARGTNPKTPRMVTVEMLETMLCGHSEEVVLCVGKKSVVCGAETRARRGIWLRRFFGVVCNGSSLRSDLRSWLGNKYLPYISNPQQCHSSRGMKCSTGPAKSAQLCQGPNTFRAMYSNMLRCEIGEMAASPSCSLNDISVVARLGEYLSLLPGNE